MYLNKLVRLQKEERQLLYPDPFFNQNKRDRLRDTAIRPRTRELSQLFTHAKPKSSMDKRVIDKIEFLCL
jgi:hypothetical protein